jgi:hypothetical protein
MGDVFRIIVKGGGWFEREREREQNTRISE